MRRAIDPKRHPADGRDPGRSEPVPEAVSGLDRVGRRVSRPDNRHGRLSLDRRQQLDAPAAKQNSRLVAQVLECRRVALMVLTDRRDARVAEIGTSAAWLKAAEKCERLLLPLAPNGTRQRDVVECQQLAWRAGTAEQTRNPAGQ
jgi:hypothetical protein